MTRRFAASAALVAFAVCLVTGWRAGNSFGTTVGRALLAMGVTLFIGLVVGSMAERALEENLSGTARNSGKTGTEPGAGDR
jgi:hypothetical protein